MNEWMKKWTNEWTNEWMNERTKWMNEWTNKRINEWTNERMNEWTNERMNEWTNERMNERMNEWTNEWMNEWFECMIVCMYVCMYVYIYIYIDWLLMMIIDDYWCILIPLKTYIRRFMDPVFLSSSRPPRLYRALWRLTHSATKGPHPDPGGCGGSLLCKAAKLQGRSIFSGLLVKNQGFSHWFMDVLHSWLLALVMENNWNWICEWIYQHFTVKNEDQIYIYITYMCIYIYIYYTCTLYIYRAHIISMYIYI